MKSSLPLLLMCGFMLMATSGCHGAGTAATRPADPLDATRPSTLPTTTASTTNVRNWFPGMFDPPKVRVKLPSDFTIAPLGKSNDWSMYDGVIWASPRTASKYEHLKEKSFRNLDTPLFWVHLSSNVAQIPNTDSFTGEKEMGSMLKAAGVPAVTMKKLHWGPYPVMAISGSRPDGSMFFSAWVGINSPDGWALLIDYRVPSGADHPTPAELMTWQQFLEQTKGLVAPPARPEE